MGIRMVESGRAERVGGAQYLEVLWILLDSSRRVSSWFRFGPIGFCGLRTHDERLEKIDKPTVLFTHIPLSRPDEMGRTAVRYEKKGRLPAVTRIPKYAQ